MSRVKVIPSIIQNLSPCRQERRVSELNERCEEIARQKDGEIGKLTKTVACLRKECDRMKNAVATMYSERNSLQDLKDTVEDGEKRVARLELERTSLQEKVAKLEEERRKLRCQLSEADNTMKRARETQQVDLQTHDDTLAKLRAEIEMGKVKDKVVEDLQVKRIYVKLPN